MAYDHSLLHVGTSCMDFFRTTLQRASRRALFRTVFCKMLAPQGILEHRSRVPASSYGYRIWVLPGTCRMHDFAVTRALQSVHMMTLVSVLHKCFPDELICPDVCIIVVCSSTSPHSASIQPRTACMEAKKDEWTAIQLDIARRAIFHDNELSFAVLEVGCRADEVVVSTEPPPVYAVRGRIAGLRTVAGMDISFFKDIEDQAIATLTVLSFPDMVVSRLQTEAHR